MYEVSFHPFTLSDLGYIVGQPDLHICVHLVCDKPLPYLLDPLFSNICNGTLELEIIYTSSSSTSRKRQQVCALHFDEILINPQ